LAWKQGEKKPEIKREEHVRFLTRPDFFSCCLTKLAGTAAAGEFAFYSVFSPIF
jgi:hypothetical protein